MGKPIYVDLTLMDNGLKHWLHPDRRHPHIAQRVRAKYRNLDKAQRAMAVALKKLDRANRKKDHDS